MLADRYRPTRFSSVIGQDFVVSQLKGILIRRRIPKAMLFGGPHGCGKTTVARIFARAVNCENLEKGEPCGKCDACKEPDVLEINVADERGIETMRNLVSCSIYTPKYRCRVIILDEFHQATSHAQNALLKPLEDARTKSIWIICTTDPGMVLPTIVSRCRFFRFLQVPADQIYSLLKKISKEEKVKVPKTLLKRIAEVSNGHVRDSINMLESIIDALACGSVDEEFLLNSIFSKNSSTAALKWLVAFFKGSMTGMLLALKEVDKPDEFVFSLVNLCEQYIYGKFLKKKAVPVDSSVKKYLLPLTIEKQRFVKLMRSLGMALNQVKRYSIDPKVALLSLTLDAIGLLETVK